MPSLTLYDMIVPSFLHSLAQLSAILTKAEAHCTANSISATDFLATRLAPDMLPLSFQVQALSNTAPTFLTRLLGTPFEQMENTETTFEQLQERIKRTEELLKSLKKEDFEGKEDAEVRWKRPNGQDAVYNGRNYIIEHALPNVYFHAAAAYMIIRHKGVQIGKLDWLGGIRGS